MNKAEIIQHIITRLSHDLDVLFNAARRAHEAATHEENIPDNKYETLALEASYVAQGQANEVGKCKSIGEDNNYCCIVNICRIKGLEACALRWC